jgi:hypothetical protein
VGVAVPPTTLPLCKLLLSVSGCSSTCGLLGLQEMEGKWEDLYRQHQQVVEERCELEEAENDSRLKAQT